MDQADLEEAQKALDSALANPPNDISFYQEKPFVLVHVLATVILGVLVISAANK